MLNISETLQDTNIVTTQCRTCYYTVSEKTGPLRL